MAGLKGVSRRVSRKKMASRMTNVKHEKTFRGFLARTFERSMPFIRRQMPAVGSIIALGISFLFLALAITFPALGFLFFPIAAFAMGAVVAQVLLSIPMIGYIFHETMPFAMSLGIVAGIDIALCGLIPGPTSFPFAIAGVTLASFCLGQALVSVDISFNPFKPVYPLTSEVAADSEEESYDTENGLTGFSTSEVSVAFPIDLSAKAKVVATPDASTELVSQDPAAAVTNFSM